MEYILLVVVILFVLFIAWREREVSRERAETARQVARERSELLTRIAHPDQVLIPVDDRKEVSLPDTEPEQDDYGMVGTIISGVE